MVEVVELLTSSDSEDEPDRAAGRRRLNTGTTGSGRKEKGRASLKGRRRLKRQREPSDDEDGIGDLEGTNGKSLGGTKGTPSFITLDEDDDEEEEQNKAHVGDGEGDPGSGVEELEDDDSDWEVDAGKHKKRGPPSILKAARTSDSNSKAGGGGAKKRRLDMGGAPAGAMLRFVTKGEVPQLPLATAPPKSAVLRPDVQAGVSKGGQRGESRSGNVETQLWTDKHKPCSVAELSIPPKKVNEVRQWLQSAIAEHGDRTGTRANKLLILRGPPGVGKSTMVELLAQELGLKIMSWVEASSSAGTWKTEVDTQGVQQVRFQSFGGGEYVSAAQDFGAFLRGAAFRPLDLANAKETTGLLSGSKGQCPHKSTAVKSEALSSRDSEKAGRSLFMIEELPYHESERTAAQFRSALSDFLWRSVHPAVLIFTEENQDRYGSVELEKVLPRPVLASPFVHQIHCNAVTDANMRKILGRVASAEGRFSSSCQAQIEQLVATSGGDLRHALLSLQLVLSSASPPTTAGVSSSRGGGRAVAAPRAKGGKGRGGAAVDSSDAAVLAPKGRSKAANVGEIEEARAKDLYLSNFHTIGKLLYAKRGVPEPGEGRGRLTFVPEDVIGQCEMEVDALSAFVQCHCIEHFGDLENLASALELLSDADLYVGRFYSTSMARDHTDPVFPLEYAVSLVGRSVAEYNRHPVKPGGGFKPMTAPRYYEVQRARRDGLRRLAHVCNDHCLDLLQDSEADVLPVRLSPAEMVTELVPFAKSIGQGKTSTRAPSFTADDESAASLASALSFLRIFNRRLDPCQTQAAAASLASAGPEVEAMLAIDDIEEDG